MGSTETQPAEGARLTHAVDVPYYHFFYLVGAFFFGGVLSSSLPPV